MGKTEKYSNEGYTGDQVIITVKTQHFGEFEVTCTVRDNIGYIKRIFAAEIRNRNPQNFRFLYKGNECSNNQTLLEIEPEINKNFLLVFFAVESLLEKSAAYTKVNNARILQRNVDECVKCCIEGT